MDGVLKEKGLATSLALNAIIRKAFGLLAGAAAVTALTWCYSAGFTGPFLLDDFYTLDKLAVIQGELSWASLRDYLNTGITGPTGRPLSLLSFLLDSTQWPTSAEPFKRTNVFLHAANGMFVFWITRVLIHRVQEPSSRGTIIAALVAMVWIFSPYHVSTVLYVVQRMAMLSTFCVLAGLCMYLKGRTLLQYRPRAGLILILMAYVTGAGVGVLAKENAALFVLIVPLVEWNFFSQDRPSDRQIRHLLNTIVVLPAMLFLVAMALKLPSFLSDYGQHRDFTLTERLLSQPRALGYYLWRYLIPGTQYVGIYGDGFTKSTGLLTPVSTAGWTLFHAGLVILAIRLRRSYPLLAFGILFFYVAHSMESSVVPLEMFFEHRSYLPSAFLWLGILSISFPPLQAGVALALLIANASFLSTQATFWSDLYTHSRLQVERNPGSERARIALARWYNENHRPEESLRELREFGEAYPIGQDAAAFMAQTACAIDDLRESDLEKLKASPYVYRSKTAPFLERMGALVDMLKNGHCKGLSAADIYNVLDNYENAFRRTPRELQAYMAVRAKLELALGNEDRFRELGLSGIDTYPNMYFAMDFCRALARMSVQEGCSCFDAADAVIEDEPALSASLVRHLTGYRAEQLEVYRREKQSVCRSQYARAHTTTEQQNR